MPVLQLTEEIFFPPQEFADPDGLLAVGGDLSVERLLLAYKSGIFPWFSENSPILWWCPNPRFVLYPPEVKVSKSMRQVIRKNEFRVTFNTVFSQVLENCKKVARPGQEGTWITDEMEEAYIQLHKLGYAYSVEVWKEGALVGGLYGVKLGQCFFGESMFSTESNASKVGFIMFVRKFQEEGGKIIDCQIYTKHLSSMGARMISRKVFLTQLSRFIPN